MPLSSQSNTPQWDARQLAGMAAYNTELRYVFSPPTSIWENSQRGEFVRIVAECYGTADRNVRTWFSFNQRQTPFLRKDLPADIFISRTILAKCLLAVPFQGWDDRIERVLIKGVEYNLDGVPLAPLLREEYFYRETFHWEYNAHEWNSTEGIEPAELNAFSLIWYYGVLTVPYWLPEHLKPEPGLEASPFGIATV